MALGYGPHIPIIQPSRATGTVGNPVDDHRPHVVVRELFAVPRGDAPRHPPDLAQRAAVRRGLCGVRLGAAPLAARLQSAPEERVRHWEVTARALKRVPRCASRPLRERNVNENVTPATLT